MFYFGRNNIIRNTKQSSSPPLGGYKTYVRPEERYRQHPVLQYQREASYDTHPANYGDPIRPLFPTTGPVPNQPLNVPVPQGSLKMSSEKYKYPFYYQKKPLSPYDYFRPYGPNQNEMQSEIIYADTPFYKKNPETYSGSGAIPFISSVNSYAPFPEVYTPWEKTGMVQTEDAKDESIMNLYRRPIAPLQDLFEYSVQDKDGFVIPLQNINFLEDGDTIKSISGKESKGPWKVNIYVNNKWVWA
uniref:Uncharacterized protein n=1 Tax=Marseillevirus LCMAC102 TaxID=2506603 RepID=A0A481YUB5_9VIRU|nr:MAG: hypothetical protein LCMAC102_03220 [Marseillevirus LCMAC102]